MQAVWIFRHIECEGPGYLEQVLDRHNIPHTLFAVDQQTTIPTNTDNALALVFMGGPMSVNDRDSWIEQECELIRQANTRKLPVLGHCLGGQLISKALGARVYANPVKEIGWLPVQRTASSAEWMNALPDTFDVFHWHGETFDLPEGADRILRSDRCTNQGYVLGRTLALQCHIEVTADMVDEWIKCYPEDTGNPHESVQTAEQMRDKLNERCTQLHTIAESFYHYWLQNGGLL